MIVPAILCGGSGTRLWPASRETYPKHFIPLMGGWSTFQNALLRVADTSKFDKPIVLTSEKFCELVWEQARAIGAEIEVVAEPCRRDSGPAVAVAAEIAARRSAKANVLILAADHVMPDIGAFHSDCLRAEPAVSHGHIVTFGIQPTEPSSAYGYLEPGDDLDLDGVRKLRSFVEKPEMATAKEYIERGYLWNSGNFFFRADIMSAELAHHAPKVAAAASHAVERGTRRNDVLVLDEASFAGSPSISIDYVLMEKTERSAYIAASFLWSDVGSWDAIWQLGDKDVAGNVITGTAHLEDCSNVLVDSAPGLLCAVIGLDDVFLITSPDAVVVGRLSNAERVKDIVSKLKIDGHRQVLAFSDAERLTVSSPSIETDVEADAQARATLSS